MSKSRAATQHGLIPLEIIERRIYFIRTHKVMLDSDLAELYGVTTKRLNEQVKRNIDRFPADFMFQLKPSRIGSFEVAICDLKTWPRRAPLSAICIYGTHSSHPHSSPTLKGASWSPSHDCSRYESRQVSCRRA